MQPDPLAERSPCREERNPDGRESGLRAVSCLPDPSSSGARRERRTLNAWGLAGTCRRTRVIPARGGAAYLERVGARGHMPPDPGDSSARRERRTSNA
jgi:hypothetical protein